MSGEGIESVDEKLTAAFERRERAQDLLVRSLVEIDGLNTKIDSLLDEKNALAPVELR